MTLPLYPISVSMIEIRAGTGAGAIFQRAPRAAFLSILVRGDGER